MSLRIKKFFVLNLYKDSRASLMMIMKSWWCVDEDDDYCDGCSDGDDDDLDCDDIDDDDNDDDDMINEMNHILNCGCEIKWSYDRRSYERNFSNCVHRPEDFRNSSAGHNFTWFHISKWPAPKVSGFIAQLVRASTRYREVTGSNPIEVLKISGFSTQLIKLRS